MVNLGYPIKNEHKFLLNKLKNFVHIIWKPSEEVFV